MPDPSILVPPKAEYSDGAFAQNDPVTLTFPDPTDGRARVVRPGDGLPTRAYGLDGAPIDDSQPGEVVFPDQQNLGVQSGVNSGDIVWWGDVTNYKSVLAEVQQLDGGSLQAETSIDTTWARPTAVPVYAVDQLTTPGPQKIMVSTVKYRFPVAAKYARIRKVGAGATQVAVFLTQVQIETTIVPGGTLPFLETTANLTAGSTFTGTSRATGATMGGPQTRFRTFEASAWCDKVSEMRLYESTDGTNWLLVSMTPVPASTLTRASTPLFGSNYRVDLKNVDASQTATSTKLASALRA